MPRSVAPEDEIVAAYRLAPVIVQRALGYVDADLVQDAAEAMVRAVPRYDPTKGATMRTWITYKAKMAALESYRQRIGRNKNRRRPRFESLSHFPTDAELDEPGEALEHPALVMEDLGYEAVEERLDARQRLADGRCEKALTEVAPRVRETMELLLAGMTQHEIADQFGVSLSAVCHSVRRFRDHLAKTDPDLN